jgi:hypothetical protein
MTDNPMDRTPEPLNLRLAPRCGAKTRGGSACQRASTRGKLRCRLHGGAPGSGAPSGERNGRYKDGTYSKASIAERRWAKHLVRTLTKGNNDGR